MEYTLTISTVIHAEDYDDTIHVSYPCRYTCEDGIHRLKYTDDEAGFTVIKLLPDGEMQIHRSRSFPITLRQDAPHHAVYETPYGAIPMVFTLESIKLSLSEDGGHIDYVSGVEINGAQQVNRVSMKLTPTERKD